MSFEFEAFIQSESWEIQPNNLSLGESQLGTEQIVATLTDVWTARITLLAGVNSLSAFRAWKISRRGRLIVDQMGPFRELAGSSNGRTFGLKVLHDDATPHDDGTGYAQGLEATSAAAAGDTRITIAALGVTAEFAAGRFFGIGSRLYQITALGGVSATEVLVDFWPPLQEDVVAGQSLDWKPRTDMRLAADDAAPITDRVGERFDVTVDLVEVL